MAENNHSETESTPPHAQLVQMAMAHWVSQIVYVAAKLSLADHSVQTGKSGFEKSLGMPVFDWSANNPEEASMFSETMVGVHGAEPPAVAAAYDFSGDSRTLWE